MDEENILDVEVGIHILISSHVTENTQASSCSKMNGTINLNIAYIPVIATQCAQPAAAFTIEISSGRGKGAGISFKSKKIEVNFYVSHKSSH